MFDPRFAPSPGRLVAAVFQLSAALGAALRLFGHLAVAHFIIGTIADGLRRHVRRRRQSSAGDGPVTAYAPAQLVCATSLKKIEVAMPGRLVGPGGVEASTWDSFGSGRAWGGNRVVLRPVDPLNRHGATFYPTSTLQVPT